jgi:hypothetical protein
VDTASSRLLLDPQSGWLVENRFVALLVYLATVFFGVCASLARALDRLDTGNHASALVRASSHGLLASVDVAARVGKGAASAAERLSGCTVPFASAYLNAREWLVLLLAAGWQPCAAHSACTARATCAWALHNAVALDWAVGSPAHAVFEVVGPALAAAAVKVPGGGTLLHMARPMTAAYGAARVAAGSRESGSPGRDE